MNDKHEFAGRTVKRFLWTSCSTHVIDVLKTILWRTSIEYLSSHLLKPFRVLNVKSFAAHLTNGASFNYFFHWKFRTLLRLQIQTQILSPHMCNIIETVLLYQRKSRVTPFLPVAQQSSLGRFKVASALQSNYFKITFKSSLAIKSQMSE